MMADRLWLRVDIKWNSSGNYSFRNYETHLKYLDKHINDIFSLTYGLWRF